MRTFLSRLQVGFHANHVGTFLLAASLVGCGGSEDPNEKTGELDSGPADSAVGDTSIEVSPDVTPEETSPDTTKPDVVEETATDTSPPEETGETAVINPCGGTRALTGKPGDACGTCKGSILRCDGKEALLCDEAKNACGGCATLPGKPGESCGTCGGALKCKGTEELACDGAVPTNLCLGCSVLTTPPGTACGLCNSGKFECSGTEKTTCKDPVSTPAPGVSCGKCGTSKYVCTADKISTVCETVDDVNACGGCGVLAGAPGSACGKCGVYSCSADKSSVTCSEPLPTVGEPCGDCATSKYICESPGKTRCENTSDRNACGGCAVLPGKPGDACSPPACGAYVCAATSMRCLGPANPVGNKCGVCMNGLFTCSAPGTTTCSNPDSRASGTLLDMATANRTGIMLVGSTRVFSFTPAASNGVNFRLTFRIFNGNRTPGYVESGTLTVTMALGNPNSGGASLGSGTGAFTVNAYTSGLAVVDVTTTTPVPPGSEVTFIVQAGGSLKYAEYLGADGLYPGTPADGYRGWTRDGIWYQSLYDLPAVKITGKACF